MMGDEPGGRFFDTNVIVYTQDAAARLNRARALVVMEAAMKADCFVISTQVMQEFYNVVLRKRWMAPAHAAQMLGRLAEHTVVPATADSVLRGVALQQRHRLSLWDALIVQAALDGRCAVLYSEDLQEGRRFEPLGSVGPALMVVNPFNSRSDASDAPDAAAHEPKATYRVAAGKRRLGRASK